MATLEIYTKIPETESHISVKTDVRVSRIVSSGAENCNIPIMYFNHAESPNISHAFVKMTWKELKDLRRELQEIEKYEHGDKPKKYI